MRHPPGQRGSSVRAHESAEETRGWPSWFAGFVVAPMQVIEDLSDGIGLGHSGNHPHFATALGTDADVEIEHPFEPGHPAHRGVGASFAQVGRILRNPRYAGAFVYGRTRVERRGDGTESHPVVPMEQWQVCIPDAHVGFIDWDEYLRNQATMTSNAAAFLPAGSRTAAPREGAALLQSRVICGHCGRRMSPAYTNPRPSRNQPAYYHYICKEQLVRYGRKTCQSMRGDLVDAEISRFVIDVMNRKNIDLALAVQEQVGAEFAEADAQRAGRIEAIRYEADLARRRFFEVDPSNRLVAAALEADWNERLRVLEEACREREVRAAARDTEFSARQVERIRELTLDFEQVWNASETGNTDRKRLLGLLIEDATLTRDGYEVTIDLRMRGGRSLTLGPLHLPRPMAQIRKTPPETITGLDRLLETHTDEATARELNRSGFRNWKGEPFTAKRVRSTRRSYGLLTASIVGGHTTVMYGSTDCVRLVCSVTAVRYSPKGGRRHVTIESPPIRIPLVW